MGNRILACVLALLAPVAGAQEVVRERPWPHELAGVPLREGVEHGSLANGVRVAWKPCDRPAGSLRIWLHVAAGALMEAPGEEGLAHLVEHMVFRGTARWPDGAVDEWARDNGLVSGPDLNAFTDWRETIYLLDLPAGDADLLTEGLSILRDFAGTPRFGGVAFAAEKAVVDAEQRERLGSDGRAWAELDRWAWSGLRVAERDLLGAPETRSRLTVEDLARFHARWYRPERLTLVLVGDLPQDPLAVARAAFGDLVAETPPPTEPSPGEASGRLGTLVHPLPEWAGANLVLRWARPTAADATWVGFDVARLQREALARTVLERRLGRLVAERTDVFQDTWINVEPPLPETPFEAFEITLMVRGDEAWSRAIGLVRRELEALLRHGVPDHELASARRLLRAQLEAAAAADAERDVEEEAEWLVAMAGDRSLDWSIDALRPELEAALRAADGDTVRDFVRVLVARPPGLALLGDFSGGDQGEDVGARLRAGWDAPVAAIEPRPWPAPPPFVHRAGEPGEIVARSEPDALGLVEVRFANGVRLVHAPAEGARVEVRAQLLGGRRTLAPSRWPLAWVAEDVFIDMGLAAHDAEELHRIFEPHDVRVNLFVEDDALVLDGGASRDELLLQCELMGAYLSAPAWSDGVWEAMCADHPDRWRELASDLEVAPWVRFWPDLFAPEGAAWVPAPDALERLELDDLRRWLEPELARAPLVVTVWGGSAEEAIDAVARTFGALPPRADGVQPARGLDTVGPRSGVAREYALDGELDRALVYLACPAGAGGVPSRAWATRLLVPVLQERLDARLRDELGLTYGVEVGAHVSTVFPRLGYVEILLRVEPEEAERARDECLALLGALARDGVEDDELDAAREQARALHAEVRWMDVLAQIAREPRGLRAREDERRFYRDVRPARVQRHARQLFRPDRASSAILRPGR